jgi:hypothetical protein
MAGKGGLAESFVYICVIDLVKSNGQLFEIFSLLLMQRPPHATL